MPSFNISLPTPRTCSGFTIVKAGAAADPKKDLRVMLLSLSGFNGLLL
jgi:hypothetical protein